MVFGSSSRLSLANHESNYANEHHYNDRKYDHNDSCRVSDLVSDLIDCHLWSAFIVNADAALAKLVYTAAHLTIAETSLRPPIDAAIKSKWVLVVSIFHADAIFASSRCTLPIEFTNYAFAS